MTQANTQNEKKKASQGSLIFQTLGLLLLASIVPASSLAQNAPHVVGPQAHPWAASTTAKTETKISGTIQEVTSKHGVTQLVVNGANGANGAVTADLGPYAGGAAKSFSPGDHVEITGWTRTSNGNNTLVARQITAGERQVVIRNEHGIPVRPAPTTSTKPQRVGASFTGGAR
jgi:hypothetical protein